MLDSSKGSWKAQQMHSIMEKRMLTEAGQADRAI